MKLKIAACLGTLTVSLTGCAGSQGPTTPSTPTTSSQGPGTAPAMTILAPPDPCNLVKPGELARLRQLTSVRPKKDVRDSFQQCQWLSRQGSEGVASVRVAVSDLRPRGPVAVPQSTPVAGDCPEKVTTSAGIFCQSHDRQSVDITRNNLHVTIVWTTTKLSRIESDSERVSQADGVNRQLAEQALSRMPG